MVQPAKPAPRKRTAKTSAKAPAKKTAAVAAAAPVIQTAPPPVPTPTAPPSRPRRGIRPLAIVLLLAVVLGVVLVGALSAQERGGPPHTFANLDNGAPATLYVPGKLDGDNFPLAPPKGQRPPVVVVAHGFSADQAIMSTISRSLAEAGYAVIAIDFRGHGSNTDSFSGDLHADIEAAINFADRSPYVDNTRIALLGHSMGASAVLESASRDARVKAVIPVSGGDTINDAVVPQNVLLLSGSGDPKSIRDRQVDMEQQLAGKTKVERVVIGGKDHVTILFSDSMMKKTISWLDGAFGVTRAKPVGIDDPRGKTLFLYLLVAVVLLFGVGVGAGRLAPALDWSDGSAAEGGRGLLVILIASIAAMPLVASGAPAGFIPQIVGPEQFGYYAVVAALLYAAKRLGVRWLTNAPSWRPANVRATASSAALALVGVYLLILPFGAIFHRVIPTPERMIIWIVGTALMAPLFLASETLIRRGSLPVSIGLGLASRVLALVVLFIGILLGFLPGVLMLVLPILVLFFLLMEVFAAGVYWRSRNVWLIALVEAAFIAWMATISGPVI